MMAIKRDWQSDIVEPSFCAQVAVPEVQATRKVNYNLKLKELRGFYNWIYSFYRKLNVITENMHELSEAVTNCLSKSNVEQALKITTKNKEKFRIWRGSSAGI